LPKIWFYFFGAWLLKELTFSAANNSARREVRRRAKGSCEGCGRKKPENQPGKNGRMRKSKPEQIVGHLNHDRNGEYHDPDNLRLHCRFCEALYHAKHVGRAAETGLSEKDNRAAALSWLTIAARDNAEEFTGFYKENQVLIDKLFDSKGASFQQFLQKNTR
jgi:hypothetical protein